MILVQHAKKSALNAPVPSRVGVALNSLWNFAGQMSPMFLAAFTIPVLIHRLGVNRFGVLTLAWILVGYFSLFDLGIGRAITKLLSETMAVGHFQSAANLIGTAMISMLLLGMCFGGALFAVSPWLTHSVLKVPPDMQSETLRSLPLLALAVPFVTVTCGLRGVLEAQQNFAAVNVLRAGLGAVSYLGPLAVLPFSHSLFPVILTLSVARILSCALHFWVCRLCVPVFSHAAVWDPQAFRALLGFGSWLTVSNILSPLMVYLDRFLIGALISVSAVTYYAAPFDAVTKLWLVPSALAGVLFPAFSEALALDNRERANSLYERSLAATFAILFPCILVIVLFAPEGLRLWLGADFARHSATTLRILAIGVFTNSLANMPYALIQASGRPDITAKLHLVEVPCYLALLYLGIRARGIEGAAFVWTLRLSIEAAILFFLLRSCLPSRLSIAMASSTTTLLFACAVSTMLPKVVFLLASSGLFAAVVWRWIFDDSLRVRVCFWLRSAPVLNKVGA